MQDLLTRLGPPPAAAAAELLSFWVAQMLMAMAPGNGDRMALLRMTSTRERLVWGMRRLDGAASGGGEGRCTVM